MTSVIIPDILPLTQLVGTTGQTVYSTAWTANVASDVVVYSRPINTAANDVTQILSSSQYSIAFIGGGNIVQVTLVTPSILGDVITITRQTPADRLNIYSNTNFTPSMLNNDFGILTLVDQQAQVVNQQIGPRYNYSAIIQPVIDTILPILLANQTWAKNAGNTAIVGFTLGTAAGKNATNNSLANVASASGPFTPGHSVVAADTAGTIIDSGSFAGTGTISSISAGGGISATPNPITLTGSLSLSTIANNTLLANISGSLGLPTANSISDIIDSAIGNTQGDILYRNASSWVVLAPGTSGLFLQTQGAAANPIWAAGNAGSVTSIATNNGLTGGTITTTGTIGLASIADKTLLSNISGGSTFPSANTLTAIIDNILGSAQGDILFRNSTVWTVLTPGTNGQFLTTGGASANVSWTSGNSGTVTSIATSNGLTGGTITTTGTLSLAPIANLDLLANISGGSAAPSPNTLTAIIDAAIDSTQGDILFRNATQWVALAPGSTGQFLKTQGAAADPIWDNSPGSGTINSGSINQLAWYAAAGTTVSGLTIVNSAGLTTTSGGVPTWVAYTGTGAPVLGTSPTITTPNTVGTETNNNASAGSVGEFVSAQVVVGSAISISNGVPSNITNISLTAGDWNVLANFGATTSIGSLSLYGGINTVSATLPDSSLISQITLLVAATQGSMPVVQQRISISSTTTVYLVQATQGSGTLLAYGYLAARRIR